MHEIKKAAPDHGIHDTIAHRWSPYVFSDKMIARDDLRSLFEAARWAASSYNEQPWRYIVATRDDPEQFEKLLSCLNDANQSWARNASVLALGLTRKNFTQNEKPNRVAVHDLGAASASLTVEATSRGITVHQMAGILPDRARDLYRVPEGFEVMTGIAMGYPGTGEGDLAERDSTERSRKTQDEFVFEGAFGQPLSD